MRADSRGLESDNLLITRDHGVAHLAGVLDFGSAWFGNPESDLARLQLWDGMMHPTFWSAYGSELRDSEGYAWRRPVLQLLWCLEYASASPRHRAVTASVCHQLEIASISFDSAEGDTGHRQ